MRIRTRLLLNALLPLLAGVVILAILAFDYRLETALQRQDRVVDEIRTGIFELNQLTSSYLLYREERPVRQYDVRHRQLTAFLEEALEPSGQRLRGEAVLAELHLMRGFFEQLVTSYQEGGDTDPALVEELRARLMGQLMVRARILTTAVNELAFQVDRDRAASMRLSTTIIVAALFGLAAALAVTLLRLNRTIIASLARLRRGTELLGAGDLDYRLGFVGADELGELAGAFDLMSERLQRITVSREKLRLSEERLRKSEATLRLAIEATGLGTFDFHPPTGELVWSDLAKLHLGLPPEAEVGYEVFLSGLHPDDRGRVENLVREALRSGSAGQHTLEFRTAGIGDGKERWLAALGQVFHDEKGEPVRLVGTTLDITERKRAEAEREQLITELSRSNRELEQFAYVASHDLQEPLRMVASYVQLLEKKYRRQLDERAVLYMDFAVEGAVRMQKLIEGLLAYSRIGRAGETFKPVAGNELFARAVGNLAGAIEEQRAEVTRDELPIVVGDEPLLVQLLQNLIGNGIKYRQPGEAPRVHVAARRQEGAWLFAVRDDGIGIEPEYFDRIFEIFQRLHTRGEYPGTGIGLALCKRIVERHHGRIWVESTPGRGATFLFTIPDVLRGAP
jgi:PAS domain S-box-containing protein